MMTIDEWQRKAIRVPFLSHGRDYDAWDCWGLCIRGYQDVLGITLPDYNYESIRDYRALAREFTNRRCSFWKQINTPEVMSVACIYRRGSVIHAGLVMPRRRIMHVELGVETCCPRLDDFRIEGYYVPADRGTTPV